ncbi:MAG: hypothetical protein A3I24_01230 [Candidatus Harrisonbacteria bacterium RIFCSPLOWO2_02_FULL_41_13b]|uniref:D-lactate dehydrogenase (cytochrome) n=1 Tax=Candidatus Harrisonbacteria bacterium RIFCSPLOWO2_02_FULL_41_13b TaxID=1798409 RepID=A0A1G1ZU34_9BACT|nr:MAG: hypothetical protein A3J53_00590 [Candidatus Harrisonbacteria bacterium RIFCSPHIGHO2_02_FULL_40_20]OGY68062.1 MAG: hypothetical protein A3I24_01230 [Candidatus Harrisonbacteria bacterium RIFCSPLOWO2_02_FULL_41_13b]
MALLEELKNIISGEVATDQETLKYYSRDASLFEVQPQAVVFPKNSEDIKKLVKFVAENKSQQPELSLTARSAGTDMTGGPLTESIVLDFKKHFNRISVADQKAVAQPGVFYRDFEKETLKHGWLLPSFPASREICAIGGMVNNNSGGEMTLKYGKTEDFIESLKMVLNDGEEYELKKLNRQDLDAKMAQKNYEGEIYRKVFTLLDKNYDLIQKSKIDVNKNSSGYNIWKVWDKEKQEFNLARLIAGAQGTLGIMTEATFRLIQAKKHSGLLVIFLKDLKSLPDIVHTILPLQPVSFESFDDHTFKLAVKFFWGFAKSMGAKNALSLAFQFLPEFIMTLTGGIPKLILLAEFEGDNQEEISGQLANAQKRLTNFPIQTRITNTEAKAKKYWAIRHESFNLLRKRVKDKRTAPFIDDLIVKPEYLPEFLPKLYAILDRYELLYTIAGHVGDGNFHIIPLMKLADESEKQKIFQVMEEVNKLIVEYHGSFSAEHNDGLIRSPYLKMLYGEKIYAIFEEIKKIFDPQNIFNPGKKVGAKLEYAKEHIKVGA